MSSLRVLVVGCGAVGALYGGKLAQAGASVGVVCRSDYETVRRDGIFVRSVWGDFAFRPDPVLRQAADYGRPADVVLVTLKVLPETDPVALIRGAVGPRTTIVLLQNGVEIETPVAAAFRQHELLSGLAFVCCGRTAPGQVRHLDFGRVVLGRFPEGESARAQQLCDLLCQVGVPCTVTTDAVTARWRKLIWNAPFNPLCALGGADTRQVLEDPEAAALVRAIMTEVCAIATALGHSLGVADIEQNLEDTRRMKPYWPSMLLDDQAGRPMEVEAILGNAVRAARRVHVPAPHLASIYAALRLRDACRRR